MEKLQQEIWKTITKRELNSLQTLEEARNRLGLRLADTMMAYEKVRLELMSDINRLRVAQGETGSRVLRAHGINPAVGEWKIDMATGEIKTLFEGKYEPVPGE